jgi:hypothetical protein
MRSLILTLIVFVLALTGSAYTLEKLSVERDALRLEQTPGTVMPSVLVRVLSLEFTGLVSDLIFFKTITYYGGKAIRSEPLTGGEWDLFYNNMMLVTDLDPYFYDPYYLGSMNLVWDAHRVKEANSLLEKAVRHREWDWTPPFYLGFNYFFFLKDNERAAYYFIEASNRPGGSDSLAPTLAARMAHKGRSTESAVLFLEEIVRKTDDANTRKVREKRLHAMKMVLHLEHAADAFKERYGEYPDDLRQLVMKGIISDIPQDPYGGQFIIDSRGSVKPTSDFIEVRKN